MHQSEEAQIISSSKELSNSEEKKIYTLTFQNVPWA